MAAPPADNPAVAADTRVSFIPLEANPELMTSLLHKLGVSPALAVHDVYSLTDADMLAFVPRPALALLLVFPVSATYESARLAEDSLLSDYHPHSTSNDDSQGAPKILWFKQTIRNACGLMGLLHAAANGPARNFVEPGSDLDKLLKAAEPLDIPGRARLLETDQSLANAHRGAAEQGDTAAPDATDDVDLHYVTFVKTEDGSLWEMDGSRKGPLLRGHLRADEDVLSQKALMLGPLKFLERESGDLRFNCVALAGSSDA
ncbi:ubiquitin carboxyl-terminal hydrolase [Podospora didyma]|uniref:Ubiquitin carboxyl-terminal hydrolase n=1 Tax=Podospora didyma TaxID=330526 RepID=A0AAE0NZA6_9PEZI|nr:ubiquitin carboxyl-terminal hydrolase [Podospora didyma]